MVRFLETDDDGESRWQNIMDQTKQRLNKIWDGKGKLPERQDE